MQTGIPEKKKNKYTQCSKITEKVSLRAKRATFKIRQKVIKNAEMAKIVNFESH